MTSTERSTDAAGWSALVETSLIASLFRTTVHFLLTRTSRAIELYFLFSLGELLGSRLFGRPVPLPAAGIRFILIALLLIASSEEPYWRRVKQSSIACALIRRLFSGPRPEKTVAKS